MSEELLDDFFRDVAKQVLEAGIDPRRANISFKYGEDNMVSIVIWEDEVEQPENAG